MNDLPPNWAAYLPLVTSLVRTLLAIGGGIGFTWAQAVTADQAAMAVSIIMMVAAGAWGLLQKIRSMQALSKAASSSVPTATPQLPA